MQANTSCAVVRNQQAGAHNIIKLKSAASPSHSSASRPAFTRVGELIVDVGPAEGGALALFVVKVEALEGIAARCQALVARDHVLRASLLRTDVALSAPLSAAASPAQDDAVLMVEANDADTAFDAANVMAAQLQARQNGGVFVFALMSRFGA